MGVQDRDLGHVADDVAAVINEFGKLSPNGSWSVFDPADTSAHRKAMKGARSSSAASIARMQETFRSLGTGLILASLLMYFLMAALDKSYVVPMTVMLHRAALPRRRAADALPGRRRPSTCSHCWV